MGLLLAATLASPQHWPASAIALAVALAVAAVLLLAAQGLGRQPLPSGATWTAQGWPMLGSLRFFTARGDFFKQNREKASNGHFSFYFGPHPIVVLSGEAARRAFYTHRALDLNAGTRVLFGMGPDIDRIMGRNANAHFSLLFRRFVSREHLLRALPYMHQDVNNGYDALDTSSPVDPFAALYPIVYQATHRTTGSHDIANDPKLLAESLALHLKADATSPAQIMFPWLPTPGKISKLWAGTKLHAMLSTIINERRRTGRREDDAMQAMMDDGDSDLLISAFVIGSLYAGLINTGVQAAWILAYLAHDSPWYAQVRAEVDQVVAKHRASDDETSVGVLRRMPFDDWEAEFPLIDACLRDSIRLNLPGASLRQNTADKEVAIGDTGVVVPKGAFALYSLEETHLNEKLYNDPYKWNPGRYLSDRAKDKKEAHAFLGWGSGLHPCLGMRMAKLEIAVTTATFISRFDFTVCDSAGNPSTKPLPAYDLNAKTVRRPLGEVFFKCTPRR